MPAATLRDMSNFTTLLSTTLSLYFPCPRGIVYTTTSIPFQASSPASSLQIDLTASLYHIVTGFNMRIPRSLGLLARRTFIMLLVSGTLAFPTQNIPRELDTSKSPPTKRQFNSSLDGPELSYNYFAAIGDSYAAGLGAGHVMDRNCKRYNQSYANLINGDPRLGDQDEVGRRFDNLACAGATIRDVLEKQISWLDDGVDAVRTCLLLF
jgi:hypothetical protein